MSPRPDVSEERRNQILEAALTVFARLGFQQSRMDDIAAENRRPYGIQRLLAQAPLWFYKLDLGWLLGTLFVQITHRGRTSGLIRPTVVEVLHYDPQTREVVVVSGWEGKTDWYRNIQREPALEVRLGRVSYRPIQELLSPEETYTEIRATLRQRPWEARVLGPLLGIDVAAPEPMLRAQVETVFRGVRFRPADRQEGD